MQKNTWGSANVMWAGTIWLLAVCLPGAASISEQPRLPTNDELVERQQTSRMQAPEGLGLREWSQIQAQLRATRYHFRSVPEAGADSALPITASNPRHRLTLSLDEAGATLSPHTGNWQLGLRTTGLGRAAQMEEVIYKAPSYAEARSDIAYASHPGAAEWYVNGSDGIEHGWTLIAPPSGSGEVLLQISVKGFRVKQAADGQALTFYNGQTRLGYNKLQVFDAEGTPLPARMRPTEDGLLIAFDDNAASYPVIVDPLIVSEVVKLVPDDVDGGDFFAGSNSLAVDGDTVVVGASNADSGGVNTGAAYVFQRNVGGLGNWGQVAKLIADDASSGSLFGDSVTIHGDTVVVGSTREDSGGDNAGAAYVFQRHVGGENNWGQVTKLLAGDPEDFDDFGFSVAVNNDTAVVGATGAGAAYVFQRHAGGSDNWGQVAKLIASDAGAFDQFGTSVAIGGDIAVVGAHFKDTGGTNDGAAYVFLRHQGGLNAWGQVSKLVAGDAEEGDRFGTSVAVSNDIVVVGAAFENEGGNNAGAAYVFQRHAGGSDNWGQVIKLVADDAEAGDRFGTSVIVSHDTVVVGAEQEDQGGADAGAVYVFQRHEGGQDAWSQVAKLLAGDADENDNFGISVWMSSDTVVVGSEEEDGLGSTVGAMYVFNLSGGNYPQAAKLSANGAESGDEFGWSIAVDGDTVIAGARKKDGTGFNSNAGAAYVFQRSEGGEDTWGLVKKLTAFDAAAHDHFGTSVAVSNDTAVVGALLKDESVSNAGAVYVFQRHEGGVDNWGLVTKLVAADAEEGDQFGESVSVNGDILVVGASQIDPINHDKPGVAYIFQRHEGGEDNWGQVAKLTASDAAAGDNFGWSVAASNDAVVVGAPRVHGDDGGGDRGALYIFQRHSGGTDNWGQVAKLTATDAANEDLLGWSVSVSGDTVVAGANGDDDGGNLAGAAYIFQRHAGGPDNWGQVTKLTAGDARAGDRFGESVTVSGDIVVVGADRENEGGNNTGAAYVFQRHAGGPDAWGQVAKLTANDARENATLGFSVAMSGSTVGVGAATDGEGGFTAGAAYVFPISFEDVDFSDAPQDGTRYPVIRSKGAGGHIAAGPLLGSMRDTEADGLPTIPANGDDIDNQADEDGLLPDPLVIGATNSISITSSASALLSLWIDLNSDDEWSSSERLLDNFVTAGGTEDIDVAIPSSATVGDSYARFRISSGGQATPSGVIADGEVEDYTVSLVLPSISIGNAVLAEGNSGQQNLDLTVTLSQAVSHDITFDFATMDDSATTADGDYADTTGMGTITGGNTSTTIDVPVNGDTKFESDESLFVNLSNPSGATIADSQGIGTIQNDDPQPSVSLSLAGSPMVENGGVAIVAASLSNPSVQPVTVNLVFSGTASGGGTDYSASGSQIVIPAGSTSGQISLTSVDDSLDEANETAIVDIDSVTNGSENGEQKVTATINDDDDPPSVTLGIDVSEIAENGGTATLTATLSAVSGRDVTVALGFNGSAGNGVDYNASNSQIVIPAGSLNATITQTAVDDAEFEPDETVITDIANVTNGNEDGEQQVTVTILDDDAAPEIDPSATAFDFGSVQVGESTAEELVISNTGNAPLTIGSISINGTNADQFGQSNNCTDAPLAPGGNCTVMLNFSPDSEGDKQASLDIASDDADENPLSIALTGAAVPATSPIINAPGSQDFGSILLGNSSQRTLQISNDGDGELVITSVSLSGADAGLFAVTDDQCTGMVAPGADCTIKMSYTPSAEGDNTAQLDIESSDRGNPTVQVTLTGEGGDDMDGVDDSDEDRVPNPDAGGACDPAGSGDGNCDGIPDSEQDNVASTPTMNGNGFVTVVTEEGTELRDVTTSAVDDGEVNNFVFPIGFFGFEVADLPPGSCTIVTIILDDNANTPFGGTAADFYFKFGPTPDFPSDHFYRFDYDGETGAVSTTVNGQDAIELHLCDGKRGDHDIAVNGSIEDPGGPGVASESSDSGSDGGGGMGGSGGSSDDDDDKWYDISGCSLSANPGPFDPVLLILLAVSIGWLGSRKRL